jgi:cytoskeletal protein CcmA (bactofilin family)
MKRIGLLLACLLLPVAALAQDVQVGEAIRFGSKVEISEAVQGPLVIAAGHVVVNAPVEGNVRLAGGRVDVTGTVNGDASLAGGTITVTGEVKRNVHAAGGHVLIDGPVGGNVSVAGGKLELGPNARVAGKVKFFGGDMQRDPAAQVVGTVEHVRGGNHYREYTAGERFLRGWVWTMGLVLLAAIIAGALPGPSQRMAQELRERPWMTLLLGFIALTSIPIAAVLIMITIIGIPIGLLGLLGYAVLLLIGYVWLSVVLGGLILERVSPATAAVTAWRVGAAVVTMLAIALLVRVPFAGGFVKLAVLACGVGMIVAVIARRTRAEPIAA